MTRNKTKTQVDNDKALKTKAKLDKLMRSGDYAECLREEVTTIYFINNLMLISTKN